MNGDFASTPITTHDTALLIVIAILLLVVMSILLVKRSRTQQRLHDAQSALKTAKQRIAQLERTAATIIPKPKQQPFDLPLVEALCKTPLKNLQSTISQAVELQRHGTATPEVIASTISRAEHHAASLERTLHHSQLLINLATRSPQKRKVAIAPLIHKLYNTHQARAVQAGITLNLSLSPQASHATTIGVYLYEILSELIDNALSFTEKGSVTISTAITAQELTITVQDTGIGIRKSEQSKLFNQGFRSQDYRVQRTQGPGLGLYTAMRLADHLGATISCESRLHHGSRFTIKLPLH